MFCVASELILALVADFAPFALRRGADAHSGPAHVSVVTGTGTGVGELHLPSLTLAAVAVVYGAVCAYFTARFVWRCTRLSLLRREAEEVTLTGQAALCWERCAGAFTFAPLP
jgi:hypothetical protein